MAVWERKGIGGMDQIPFRKDFILDKVRIMPKVTSKLQLTVPKKIADHTAFVQGTSWIGFP